MKKSKSQRSLVLSMLEITPDLTKSGPMLDDMQKEIALANSIKANDSIYLTAGNVIRMEWINNWLQRFNGAVWALELLTGQQIELPFEVPTDWTWDDPRKMWMGRFDKTLRKAYWCSLREPRTNVPVIVMTVEYYPDKQISKHMYVSRTLQSSQKDYSNLLLYFHSRVAYELQVKVIETNPVPFVRELLLKDDRVVLVPQAGGFMQIDVKGKDFHLLWQKHPDIMIE